MGLHDELSIVFQLIAQPIFLPYYGNYGNEISWFSFNLGVKFFNYTNNSSKCQGIENRVLHQCNHAQGKTNGQNTIEFSITNTKAFRRTQILQHNQSRINRKVNDQWMFRFLAGFHLEITTLYWELCLFKVKATRGQCETHPMQGTEFDGL